MVSENSVLNFPTDIFVVFIKYGKLRDGNVYDTVPKGTTPAPGAGQIQAAPGHDEVASELHFDSDPPRFVYRFLVVFLFRAVSVRIVLSFRRHHGLHQQ